MAPGPETSGNEPFHGDGGGFTAADPQCRDAALQVLRFQRVQ
jgi:hypothetical protein